MSQTAHDVVVKLQADVIQFERGMDRAQRRMRGVSRSGQNMGAALASAARVGAAAAAALAVGVAAMGRSAAAAAVQIDNLSRQANASPREFQRMAAAADTVGIQHEKLSDILRDVQDRIGDFLSTGGGPMADFFENIAPLVGVTADQFARLSGPEALQLYVSSLEAANLTQAEMTFYMEAMASDATLLIPLLRDNGRAMQELGDAAERAGRVLSNDAVRGGAELDRTLRAAGDTIRTAFNAALLENADELQNVADLMVNVLVPAMNTIIDVAGFVARALAPIVGTLGRIAGAVRDVIAANQDAVDAGIAGGVLRRDGRHGPGMTTGTPLSGNMNFMPPLSGDSGTMLPPTMLDEVVFGGGGSGGGARGGGGGGGTNPREGFEALQAQFATEREMQLQQFETQLEMLREYRANRVATEEEFNELEARIRQEHADRMYQIDSQGRRAQMQLAAGMMGDLATILQSGGERNLEIVRKLRVAEALITGYQAAVDAWQRGMAIGGPPTAAAFTAGSLLRTGALIAQMQSAGSGGGGAGMAMGGAGGGASVPTQTVMIDFTGGTPAQIDAFRSFADTANEAARRGYLANFVVNA